MRSVYKPKERRKIECAKCGEEIRVTKNKKYALCEWT